MCGIVGIINYRKNWQPKLREIFIQLLLLDVVRGKDSTGVFKAQGKEVDWRKAACPSWEFFSIKNVDEFFNGIGDYPFVVGHNRWATRGKVEHKNAHPFEEGKITLVHNGTLNSVYQLPDYQKFDVDSQMIAHSINKIGIEETTKKMGGAYALAWFDAKKKTLNLLRNEDRPLFLLDIPKEDMYLFGSEVGLLKWVAMRNGYIPGEWKSLEPHMLHTFEEGERLPKVKKTEPYKSSYSYGGAWQRHWGSLRGEADDGESLFTGNFDVVPGNVSQPHPAIPKRTEEVKPLVIKLEDIKRQIETQNEFKQGDTIYFSINDFQDKVCQGGFIPIIGDAIGEDGFGRTDIVIRGNYSNGADDLIKAKTLFKATITSVSGIKNARTLIQVKDVVLTEEADPFYMTHEDRQKWAKERKQAKKPEEKPDPSKICSKCYKQTNNLFLVYKTGGPRNMCLECLHGFDPDDRLRNTGNVVPIQHIN